jgi:hypothetical protein
MDLDDLIRSADPVLGTTPPSGTSAATRWTYTQIVTQKSRRRVVHRPSGRPVLAYMMALGLVIAVVATVGVRQLTQESPGRSALLRSAHLVSSQVSPQPGPGQYLYTETRSLYEVTIYQKSLHGDALLPVATSQYFETEQSWADGNGDGTGVLTRSPLEFSSTSDEAAWNATDAGTRFSSQFERTVNESSLQQSVPNLSALSSNPRVLSGELAGGLDGSNVEQIPDGPTAVFQRAARLLVGPDSGMTPSLAAALYDVMADQPGISLVGSTSDHRGRQGIGVASGGGGASELIINSSTGLALEVQYPPPVASLPAPSGGVPVLCSGSTTCGSSVPLTPNGVVIVASPIWTDAVSSQIVASVGATEPIRGATT